MQGVSKPVVAWILSAALAGAALPAQAERAYAAQDFAKIRKYDAHVHANTTDPAFLAQARQDGFELLSINVDYPDFPSLEEQARITRAMHRADPDRFHFATAFSMRDWGTPAWAEHANDRITKAVADGAVAVKIWKNVGMVERDASGALIMIDDPGFDPVVRRIVALGIPLIAHQAEPYNCWLPLEQMTNEGDREYFREHPQYHMYLHPEQPGYETLMAARDRFVTRHPELRFVGAHMASLEWSVDRLAAFLDAHPNANIDLAARMTAVQYQSVRDRDKVRRFFVRYAGRLLYATDLTQEPAAKPEDFRREAHEFWLSDWRYLATDDTQHIDAIQADVAGLALPRSVIRKIYYTNAKREFVRRVPAS
jgi:predicted TIM-barrel fold metal-dependent hydrolase